MNKEEKLNRSKIITIVFGISGVILMQRRQAGFTGSDGH